MQSSSLKSSAAFASGIGQRFHAAVVDVAAAVEDDVLDASLDGPFSQELTDRSGRGLVGARLTDLRRSGFGVEAAATVSPRASWMTCT